MDMDSALPDVFPGLAFALYIDIVYGVTREGLEFRCRSYVRFAFIHRRYRYCHHCRIILLHLHALTLARSLLSVVRCYRHMSFSMC